MPRPHPLEFHQRAVEFARERAKPIAKIAEASGSPRAAQGTGCARPLSTRAVARVSPPASATNSPSSGARTGCSAWRRRSWEKPRPSCQREQLPLALTLAFIEAEKANYPITLLCRTVGDSTSGFYEWPWRQEHPASRTTANEVQSVEATGFEPANLLTASQALYQLSYAPEMLPV